MSARDEYLAKQREQEHAEYLRQREIDARIIQNNARTIAEDRRIVNASAQRQEDARNAFEAGITSEITRAVDVDNLSVGESVADRLRRAGEDRVAVVRTVDAGNLDLGESIEDRLKKVERDRLQASEVVTSSTKDDYNLSSVSVSSAKDAITNVTSEITKTVDISNLNLGESTADRLKKVERDRLQASEVVTSSTKEDYNLSSVSVSDAKQAIIKREIMKDFWKPLGPKKKSDGTSVVADTTPTLTGTDDQKKDFKTTFEAIYKGLNNNIKMSQELLEQALPKLQTMFDGVTLVQGQDASNPYQKLSDKLANLVKNQKQQGIDGEVFTLVTVVREMNNRALNYMNNVLQASNNNSASSVLPATTPVNSSVTHVVESPTITR